MRSFHSFRSAVETPLLRQRGPGDFASHRLDPVADQFVWERETIQLCEVNVTDVRTRLCRSSLTRVLYIGAPPLIRLAAPVAVSAAESECSGSKRKGRLVA
jgi:hypothetical protein